MLLAEDSHEMTNLISSEEIKIKSVSSAVAVISVNKKCIRKIKYLTMIHILM